MSCVMRKSAYCTCENKSADQLHGNCAADQHLCFCNIDSTIPLLPKFQASSHLLWLYSPVCGRAGLKPQRQVFSPCGFYLLDESLKLTLKFSVLLLEHPETKLIKTLYQLSLIVRKPVCRVSDQVPHKLGCTTTEDS